MLDRKATDGHQPTPPPRSPVNKVTHPAPSPAASQPGQRLLWQSHVRHPLPLRHQVASGLGRQLAALAESPCSLSQGRCGLERQAVSGCRLAIFSCALAGAALFLPLSPLLSSSPPPLSPPTAAWPLARPLPTGGVGSTAQLWPALAAPNPGAVFRP